MDKCPNTPVEAYAAIDTAGCSKDSDGDGVPDYLDKCPNTPVEAYATIDTAGCSKDSDGDGVPDYLDKCPNTPVEAFAAIDTAGCVKDSDGDGVPDFLDRCPNTPAEAIGAVNSDGCVKDSDGDGVPDFLDKCPNTPKTEFANIDTAGCPKAKPIVVAEPEPEPVAAPILKQEEKKVFERAMHGIQFASGKDVINPTSYPILDAIVLIMEENPTYFLTIHGHTDNVGKPESNRVLSEKRAKAVKNYLIDKGVEFVRVSTQGFGDSKPLVSNNTKANQAKNRRVEFIIRYEKMVEIE
ncbi:MAG: OmpA family protein [Prevotellaceae bacterium]|nr:OmpA family protein [Prevotellaceae bacterium]